MASTTKNTCLGKVKTKTSSPSTQRTEKEKIKTPSSATDTTAQGRRSTKPMVSRSSSSKGLSVSSTPNYLKGTVRSSMDAAKIPNKQAADDTSLKYSTTRRQSIDKPPSPAQLNRTLSSSPKERRLTTPSPPPKKTISSKTLPTKTQPSKPSNIKKCAGTTPRARRDQSRSSSAATTPTPSSPEKDENLVVKPQVEDKEIHVEPIEVQSSPTHDHASIDAIPTEEPQVVTKSPTQEPHNQVADSLKEEEIIKEEEEIIKEENPTPPEESDEVNVEVKQGEDDSENVSEKANQVEENEAEISGGKTESHNVVLKRQDTQGKKESPAYNNVIEETASKLVQKRKGKVLALVGAFETVINLESDNQQNEGA